MRLLPAVVELDNVGCGLVRHLSKKANVGCAANLGGVHIQTHSGGNFVEVLVVDKELPFKCANLFRRPFQ